MADDLPPPDAPRSQVNLHSPRLRIHHLMACAVVAAIQLTLWRNAIPEGMIDQLPGLAKAVSSIDLCLADIGLTFGLLSIYWYMKGYAALAQPGQWLLVLRLLYPVQLLFGRLVVSHLRATGPWGKPFALWSDQNYYDAFVSVLHIIATNFNAALPLLFYAWCAWRVADTRPWRIYFLLRAAKKLSDMMPVDRALFAISGLSLSHFLGAKSVFLSVLMLSVLTWIIVTERRSGRERFWTHWLGVGLSVAGEVLWFASDSISLFGWY